MHTRHTAHRDDLSWRAFVRSYTCFLSKRVPFPESMHFLLLQRKHGCVLGRYLGSHVGSVIEYSNPKIQRSVNENGISKCTTEVL